MKNSVIQKSVSFVLAVILLSPTIFVGYAYDNNSTNDAGLAFENIEDYGLEDACERVNNMITYADSVNSPDKVVDLLDSVYQENETKYYSTTGINEAFVDNVVLVYLKHDVSLDVKTYTPEDFPEIDVASVKTIESNRILGEKVKSFIQEKEVLKAGLVSEYKGLQGSKVDLLDFLDLVIGEEASLLDAYSLNEVKVRNYNQALQLYLPVHSKQSVLDAVKELEKREDVLAADVNCLIELCAVPNEFDNIPLLDVNIESEKKLRNALIRQEQVDSIMNFYNAWDITTGSSTVKVGILDQGINGSHPDLYNNIDTVHSVCCYEPTTDNPLQPSEQHGTIVAGIIGAEGNNGIGLAGVCWNVKLVSYRLDSSNNSFFLNSVS